eukprot:Nk52_evm1s1557 gene=Nk52_evmTU1s1557
MYVGNIGKRDILLGTKVLQELGVVLDIAHGEVWFGMQTAISDLLKRPATNLHEAFTAYQEERKETQKKMVSQSFQLSYDVYTTTPSGTGPLIVTADMKYLMNRGKWDRLESGETKTDYLDKWAAQLKSWFA